MTLPVTFDDTVARRRGALGHRCHLDLDRPLPPEPIPCAAGDGRQQHEHEDPLAPAPVARIERFALDAQRG
jgi:hypothetical protein